MEFQLESPVTLHTAQFEEDETVREFTFPRVSVFNDSSMADAESSQRAKAAIDANSLAVTDDRIVDQLQEFIEAAPAKTAPPAAPKLRPKTPVNTHGASEASSSVEVTDVERSGVYDLEVPDDDSTEALANESMQLSTVVVAREAFRHRLIQLSVGTRQRSAYEIVFILMAFAMTTLLVAPPLVEIILALRGVQV